MNYYTDAFKHYADCHGRATRSHYWFFTLINFLVLMFLLFVPALMGAQDIGAILYVIYGLSATIPAFAVSVRRLQDIGKSGWFLLLYLIPLIGAIVLLVWLCRDSDSDNQYGPNPKASEMKS